MQAYKTLLVLCVLLIWTHFLCSATISGFITRAGSNEPLQYVNVRIAELRIGAQSNRSGYFVITINSPGTYTLEATLISYGKQSHRFTVTALGENLSHNFEMEKTAIELGTIRVEGSNNKIIKALAYRLVR